jgi:hypothetical protein
MHFDAGTKWSFSTSDMAPDERGASVRGLRERGILHLEPLPDLVARVEITKYALPGVKILAGTLSGLLQIGSANDPGGQDHLFLGINLTGRSAVRQPGREFELDNGEAALFSCIDEGFSAYRPTPVSFLGLRVAHKVLAPLGVRLDDGRMRSISPETACLRLLTTYFGSSALGRPLMARSFPPRWPPTSPTLSRSSPTPILAHRLKFAASALRASKS